MSDPVTLGLLVAVALALIGVVALLFQRSPIRRRPQRGAAAALLALADGDRVGARELLVEAVQSGEESPEAFLVLGRLLREQGATDRALQIHSSLLARPQLGPEQRLLSEMESCRDLLQLGRHQEAEQRLARLEEHYVDADLTELRGMALLRQGNLEGAAQAWAKGAKLGKDGIHKARTADVLGEISRALLRAEKHETAERWARQANDIDASRPVAHLVLGEIAQLHSAEEKAEEYWLESLRCGGADLVLGRLLELSLKRGRVEALLDTLENLRIDAPQDAGVARAVLDLRLRRGDFEEFFALLESDDAPQGLSVAAWAGWMRHLLGRNDESGLRRLVSSLPESFGAHLWRCQECGQEDREPRRACTTCGCARPMHTAAEVAS